MRVSKLGRHHLHAVAALALLGQAVAISDVAAAQQPSGSSQPKAQEAALAIGAATDAILKSISDVTAGSPVETFEAAILFSISQLGAAPTQYVDEGLKAAAGSLTDGPARTAVLNVLRMKQRKLGTAGIGGNNGGLLLTGPTVGSGGNGGTANYSN